MSWKLNRRLFLASVGGMASVACLRGIHADDQKNEKGLVIGHPEAAATGNAVLAAGGNAVDAIVTAALVAGVVAIPSTGIGGYGGHAVISGLPGEKKAPVLAIDFNTTAPAAMKPDQFGANEAGEVPGNVNMHGWLSAGVPGVLAGLQSALDQFGTRKFSDVVGPAIKFARDGFPIKKNVATALANARARLAADPGSAKLFFDKGQPLAEGATFRNPDLAAMLESLARENSVRDFYQGKISRQIAAAFRAGGGLVNEADLAGYSPHDVPLQFLWWNGLTIHTPPPTAGGLTVLQTLAALQASGWPERRDPADQMFVECLRVAWHDRLSLLGDLTKGNVLERLNSEDYARETAERVKAVIATGKPIVGKSDGRTAGGTIHLNAVDASGLAVAMTLTHGESLGAQVTVDGLGLVLGHGMSRFDPRPGRPNSPGPRKRPLHNMCPTIVTKDDKPILAIGATGGRRIVSGLVNVLARRVGEGKSLADAVKAPRLHTEGSVSLSAEEGWAAEELKGLGYTVTKGSVSSLSAIEINRDGHKLSFKSAAR